MEALITLFWFIIIITPIVFIHELGHFLFARLFGVKVDVFSIGFGKAVYKWRDRYDTTWQIALIPLGGYIKMHGDENAASVPDMKKINSLSDEEKKISFFHKKLWQKALIVFGGPLANYVLAVLLFMVVALYNGEIIDIKSEITAVHDNSPAQNAGLQVGDVIVELDGEKVASFVDIKTALALSVNKDITISYVRDNTHYQTNITPQIVETHDITGGKIMQSIIGVSFEKYEHIKIGFFDAAKLSVSQTMNISYSMLKAVLQMLTGKRGTDDLGGPIKIAKHAVKYGDIGLIAVLLLVAMLSVNLGLVNLLPIPMLDGGHLFYYAVEAIIRRPINHKIQLVGFKIGFAILISLMAFSFWNDLKGLEVLSDLKSKIFN
jgi:regulator of sigma E protease